MPRYLAIDPGPIDSAYVLYDGEKILEKGITNSFLLRTHTLPRLLHSFATAPAGLVVVLEMIASYGMPVGAEVFNTCLWIGRMIEVVRSHEERIGRSIPVILLPRKEVKLHLCGSNRANDSTVRAALLDRFGPKGTKKEPGVTYGLKSDLWAAFAVAVTAYDQGLSCDNVDGTVSLPSPEELAPF